MNEKSYLTPSLSNSPSSGNPPPPYRYPTTASTTPSTSRPSSRPSSPPPLPHGSSLPTSPININNNNSNGSPGTFSLNLGGGRYGGYYVIKLPMIIQRILGLLLRRWKSLLFIAIFGTLAAFGMFGAMWTEWREMTYTRRVAEKEIGCSGCLENDSNIDDVIREILLSLLIRFPILFPYCYSNLNTGWIHIPGFRLNMQEQEKELKRYQEN